VPINPFQREIRPFSNILHVVHSHYFVASNASKHGQNKKRPTNCRAGSQERLALRHSEDCRRLFVCHRPVHALAGVRRNVSLPARIREQRVQPVKPRLSRPRIIEFSQKTLNVLAFNASDTWETPCEARKIGHGALVCCWIVGKEA